MFSDSDAMRPASRHGHGVADGRQLDSKIPLNKDAAAPNEETSSMMDGAETALWPIILADEPYKLSRRMKK